MYGLRTIPLKTMSFRIPFGKTAAVAASLVLATASQAAMFVTQITGNLSGSVSPDFNRIQIDWATPVSTGLFMDQSGLSDLTISFFNDSTLVYTDAAIIGGVAQPIGGVSRALFDFNFTGISGILIGDLDNDLNQEQLGAATGVTYNIYGLATSSLNIALYQNGTLQYDETFTVLTQNTTAVPEPGEYAALAAAACVGVVIYRKRRAA